MEWERQHAVCTLVIEVERRGPAERREQRVGGKRPRRHVQESFREFKGFRSFIGIESKHEVGLYVWYVLQDQVDVFGYLPDLVNPQPCACLRLSAQIEPRFDTGQQSFEPVTFEPLKVWFRKKGQTAFSNELDAARRHGFLNRVHVVVELDSKIGIVPGYNRSPELLLQKP